MKKLFLSLMVLMYALHSNSQTEENFDKGGFRLGVSYSYENNFSSDRIIIDEYRGYTADYNQLNYTAGLSLDYSITSRLMLVSGINYSDKGFTGVYYCQVCDLMNPPPSEKIELQFIEVPITAKYYFIFSEINVFGEGGIGNLWRLNNNTDFEGENYLMSAKIGGGVEYPFRDKFSFQFSIDYSQNLTDIFQESDYAYQMLGIKWGLVIDL